MKPAASAKTWRENKEKALTSSALLCLFRIVISNGGFQFCCCCFFSPTRPKTRKSQGVTNVRNRFFIQGLRHFLFVYVFTIILLLTFFRDLNNVTTLYCVLGCCFVFAFLLFVLNASQYGTTNWEKSVPAAKKPKSIKYFIFNAWSKLWHSFACFPYRQEFYLSNSYLLISVLVIFCQP